MVHVTTSQSWVEVVYKINMESYQVTSSGYVFTGFGSCGLLSIWNCVHLLIRKEIE